MTRLTGTTIVGGITCRMTDCITCGLPYTVPLTVFEQHREHGGYHCCPNGHRQGWSDDESEEAKIRRERDSLKQETARLEDRVREEREGREAAERSAAAQKGQNTKLRKRASAGVCPCCNRSFENLRRHMKNKHPGFAEAGNVVPLERKESG